MKSSELKYHQFKSLKYTTWNLMESSEIKWHNTKTVSYDQRNWNQVKSADPSETTWNQLKPSEIKWNPVKSDEVKRNQLKSASETKVKSYEIKWNQVSPCETTWYQANSHVINANQLKSTRLNPMASSEVKWNRSGSKWIPTGPSESKWVHAKMNSKGTQWFQIISPRGPVRPSERAPSKPRSPPPLPPTSYPAPAGLIGIYIYIYIYETCAWTPNNVFWQPARHAHVCTTLAEALVWGIYINIWNLRVDPKQWFFVTVRYLGWRQEILIDRLLAAGQAIGNLGTWA